MNAETFYWIGMGFNLILIGIVYTFLFFGVRACVREWRNQERNTKRYGTDRAAVRHFFETEQG